MKLRDSWKIILISLFSVLLTIVCFSQTVSAVTIGPNDFDDGIKNWKDAQKYNEVGNLNIGDSLQLGYSFGLAQDTNGNVTSGGDGSVVTDSITNGVNTQFSKMNIFLNSGGKYISSVFQASYNNVQTNQESVSSTSPDFMIAPSTADTLSGITPKAFNILGNPDPKSTSIGGSGNIGLSSKQYFVGTDANGNPAYKIMGHFTRNEGSGFKNGTYNMEVELLLRASPTNSAIVQREMYVKNLATTPAEFVTLFGEDTKLGASGSGNDRVPVYDLGNKQGLYIQDQYSSKDYRLMVTNQTPDGFDSYNGQERVDNWASGLTDGKVTGTGAEANNNPAGTRLTGNIDTAYVLKWNSKTLAPNETAHFGSTMGVTAKPYSIPTPTKTYTNETRSGGVNKVGDKLKFNLKMTNNGYGAKWRYDQLVDKLPAGLQVDASTLRLNNNGGTTQILDPSDYDSTTNTVTIPPALSLTDEQHATVTFEAQITNAALGSSNGTNTLTNTAEFTGVDVGNNETDSKTFKASVDIKVDPPDYNYSFTKLIKKHGDTNYSTSVDGKKGDIVDYQIIYTVNSTSKDSLQEGAVIDDDLPAGLDLDIYSIKIWGPKDPDSGGYSQTHINTGSIKPVDKGQRVKIQFSAKVTAATAGILTNTAEITNVKTTGNQTFAKQLSSAANLNVQNVNAITSVPTKIDFGSTNMFGKNKVLDNASTVGELIVAHPDDTSYNVTVAYDNDNPNSQMVNNNGDTLSSDSSGLIFVRQRSNKATDLGTWQPLTPTGTTIQSSNFTDYDSAVNLTNYVGAGDWQIKISKNTLPGAYNGTLTWGLTESV